MPCDSVRSAERQDDAGVLPPDSRPVHQGVFGRATGQVVVFDGDAKAGGMVRTMDEWAKRVAAWQHSGETAVECALKTARKYHSANGQPERFPDLAAELVRLKVDLIVTRGTTGALAAKNARIAFGSDAAVCPHGTQLNQFAVFVGAAAGVYEAGFTAGGFPGAEKILCHFEKGASRRRVGLRAQGRAPGREGALLEFRSTVRHSTLSGGDFE